ncbi:MAG: hypothetical protein JWO11_2673 [Nocardioides sp.]|nr:hypothetical protein [Nocardioides sp.]
MPDRRDTTTPAATPGRALPRLNGPCGHGAGPCGAEPSRPYPAGPRCPKHAPVAAIRSTT